MTTAAPRINASPPAGPPFDAQLPPQPPSPLLASPGAVPADPPDEAVPGHYGDPHREQRTLTESAGLVDRSHRGVLRVTGADRLSWLHTLTTQHLAALAPMTAVEGLVLDPRGRVEQHFGAVDDGQATWIDVEPGHAPALLDYLERMRFLLRVEPADVTADHAVLSLVGPSADEVLGAAGVDPPPATPRGATVGELGLLRRAPTPGPGGVDLLVPRQQLANVVARLRDAGASLAGLAAYEALRVADRLPRLGRDTDDKTIPHEVGWLETAVHLQKGCYRGQETVARVHNLGRPPRRLVLLHLDGSDSELPTHRAPVLWDGSRVGWVGTAVRHHELGPIALAVVKRSTPADAELTAGGVPARVDDGTP